MMTTLSSSSVFKEQELPKKFIDISARSGVQLWFIGLACCGLSFFGTNFQLP
jgi:hypothetical protein